MTKDHPSLVIEVNLTAGYCHFFHRLDVGFLEWLRGSSSMQRLVALLDSFFVFFGPCISSKCY